MDRWDALPGPAQNGRKWLDQIALGGKRHRTQTQILFDQKRRQTRTRRSARAMDHRPLSAGRSLEGATCLILVNLDDSIKDWRQQMIDGGLASAERLAELESHLLDD